MDRVLVIAWLRYRLLINRLRRGEGIWNLVGVVLLAALWGLASVGAAVGVGLVMAQALHQGHESLLFKLQVGLFLAATLAGVLLPLMVEKGQGGPVTARLLTFPVTARRLFWMSQTALALSADHLFYFPVLAAAAVVVVMGPGSPLWGLVVVLSLWLSILAWGQAVGLGTEVLLRGRRSREALAVVAILLILAMGMGPGVIGQYMGDRSLAQLPVLQQTVTVAYAVGRTLAPYQAAAGLQATRAGETGAVVKHLVGVWLWILPGLLVSRWVFTRFYLGDRGRLNAGPAILPHLKSSSIRPPLEWRIPVGFLPPAVTANAFKDLRIILRSLAGRLILVLAPVLMGFIGWSVLRDISRAFLGLQTGDLRFFGMLVYVSLTANSQAINSMAYEGSGVQSYFLMPVKLPWVLLGKNLGLWFYQLLVLVICLAALLVVGSWPGPVTFIAGILLYCSLVVYRSLVGNILSCLFPSPRAMSSRKERTSAMGNVLSLVGFFLFLPLAWLFAALPLLAGNPLWQPVGLAVLLLITVGLHLLSLRPVAALMMEKRERVVAALRRKDD